MISHFFIDRPIFATVLSTVITLTGTIALFFLPVAQYPRITPPGIAISISYPGASAQEVADAIGAPIEQQVNGVPGMLYMSSQSGNDGSYSLTVTFDIGTDVQKALVQVQERVTLAMPQLPSAVQNQGITIRKKTPDMLMIVNFISPNGRYDDKYLSNYATIYVKDELLRVEGISDVNIQGQRDYSMRVWLDPQQLAARNVTAVDVASAIRSQNVDAPAGRIGQPPIGRGQQFQYPLDTLGRLVDPEQFGNIVIKIGGRPPQFSPNGILREPLRGTKKGASPSAASMIAGAAAGVVTPMPSPSADPSSMDDSTTSATDTSSDSLMGTVSIAGTINTSISTALGSGILGGDGSSANSTGSTVGANSLNGGIMDFGPPSPSTSVVRLRDVARIELGAQNYNTLCSFNGKPSVGLGLYQLPGTNALDVGDNVRKKMEELKAKFPDDVDYKIAYDTTPFIRDSVNDVVRTLFEAIGLVAIVVLVFLQSWRAALIPLLAVPVSLIGTLAVMAAMNFSLNNISLFGMVLAIGIVVDDAIVVVENVERWMDRGLDPRAATRKAMEEVTGPIIAVALVLCAVFVPCAFISGITGQFFRQFAISIAVSMIFSTINSLTFSPAMAAILLKPRGERHDPLTWLRDVGRNPLAWLLSARHDPLSWLLDSTFGWFFWIFNRVFDACTSAYAWVVGKLMRLHLLVLIAYVALLVLTGWTFQQAPRGFIPQQDQGRLIVNVQLPDAASLERSQEAVLLVEQIARETPGVSDTVTTAGSSFLLQANSPNFASMFIVLDPFDKRQKPDLRDTAIMAKLRKKWAEAVPDATVTVFGSAPIPGLGSAGGFKFLVEDRGGMGVLSLEKQMGQLVQKIKDLPNMNGATTQFRSKIPQYFIEVDRDKIAALGVSLEDVNQTLDMYLGSLYVNSYNDFGRHWQVTIQADGKYRSQIEKINLFEVRNKNGDMVPISTVAKVKEIGGPISVTRYNLYTSAAINGNVQPGGSTGDAIQSINDVADQSLPRSMRIEWTELMFIQIKAGNTAIYVFILAVMSVFLALSALYESWALPLAVILVVPLCLLCSVAGVLYTNRDVNIFVQIGLVVLVGLACKNAILIVEFAKQLHQEGQSVFDATKEASRLRLRPILMTSFAFIFGVLPLVVASGAGAEMRRSLGIAVFSGMLGVTVFGIFLTPVFFFVIQGVSETHFIKSRQVRSFIAHLVGASLGWLAGYCLAQLDIGKTPWGPVVGACAGLLIIRTIRNVRIRKPKPDPHPAAPINGETQL